MTKILSLLIVAMMILHIIRPLGLPGLRKRSDFWKLAVGALAAMMLTVVLSHTGG
jgi:cytochrome c oxidase assembly factor CtaG